MFLEAFFVSISFLTLRNLLTYQFITRISLISFTISDTHLEKSLPSRANTAQRKNTRVWLMTDAQAVPSRLYPLLFLAALFPDRCFKSRKPSPFPPSSL